MNKHLRFPFVALIAALICLLPTATDAQNALDPGYQIKKNVFKNAPFHLLSNNMRLSYERYFREGRMGIQVAPFLIVRQRRFSNVTEERHLALGTNIQYRIYYAGDFTGKRRPAYVTALYKAYGAPYYQMRYGELRYSERDDFGGITVTGGNNFFDQMLAHEGGFLMGVQTTLFDRLVFDINFGAGYRNVQVVTDNPFGHQFSGTEIISPTYSGVVPRLGFQIGVAF